MSLRFARFLAFLALLPVLAACASSGGDDPSSPGAPLAQLGKRLEEKGEIGPAIDFYRRALRADPQNFTATKGLASVLETWGDKPGAAEIYKNGVAAWPRNGDLRRDYGKLLIALDRPGEAKEQFEAALAIDSGDIKARTLLGVADDYLGEHRKAQKTYLAALEKEPGNLATINNLAYSYILSRRYDLAIKALEPHTSKPSATPAMRQNLALAYGLAGMDADAERTARIDLPPEKVADNMNYYRAKRAELKMDSAPYAELGTYATEAMAVAQIDRLKDKVGKTGGDLRPVILPEVSAPGGTPRFAVRMMGCTRPSDVSRLCDTLAKAGIPCVAKGKGGE